MRVIDTKSDAVTVELIRDELATLAQALNEVRNGPDAIQEWEFHTRMGVSRAEADELARLIRAALDG